MIRFTTGRLVLWAILLSALYFVVAAAVPPPFLIEGLNGAFLGVGLAVGVVYAPLVWRSLWNSSFDRASQLSIAIGLLWLSIFLSRAWSAYYRFYGEDRDLLNHPIIGFIVYIAIIGGALFVSAPGYYRDDKPAPIGGRNRFLLIGFGLSGALLAIFFKYGSEGLHTLVHLNGRN